MFLINQLITLRPQPFIGGESQVSPSAFLTIISSVVMMMGDWQFVQTYAMPYANGTLYYPTLNFIFLILFILLMPILFINLLIGLAVGDIDMVLKNARLKRLAMQVQYHTALEQRWVPAWLLRRTHKSELKIYPNQTCRRGFMNYVSVSQ